MAFNISYKESPENSRCYIPTEDSGIIDVLRGMAWTGSPQSSRADVPYVVLEEFQQSTGQLIASILYYSRMIEEKGISALNIWEKADTTDLYKNKYFGTPTGFRYILPYFNKANINRATAYTGDDVESPFAKVSEALSKVGPTTALRGVSELYTWGKGIIDASIAGKVNFDFPKAWTGTALETYDVAFDLSNTNGKYEDVVNNRKFCHLISYQNTPSRRSFAIIDPPVIYSMAIPGIVDLPACYISSLTITNLGNTRTMMIEGVNRTIPEAYRISLKFTSLLMPTRNIMQATESGQTVKAIQDEREAKVQIDGLYNLAKNIITPENNNIVTPSYEDFETKSNNSASNRANPPPPPKTFEQSMWQK
jgi:hypothetical protein